MAEQIKGSKTGTPITRAPTPISRYDDAVDSKMREDIDKWRPAFTTGSDAKPHDVSKVEKSTTVGTPFNPCRS
jgi:hypothetical protein